MAYDEELADRIRELVGDEANLTEMKMFGGLAFLVGGNMAIAASGQGGVLVRVDPVESETLVATTNARLMEMRGRRMRGWLRIGPDHIRTKGQLAKWVGLGTTYARSLPEKRQTNPISLGSSSRIVESCLGRMDLDLLDEEISRQWDKGPLR